MILIPDHIRAEIESRAVRAAETACRNLDYDDVSVEIEAIRQHMEYLVIFTMQEMEAAHG